MTNKGGSAQTHTKCLLLHAINRPVTSSAVMANISLRLNETSVRIAFVIMDYLALTKCCVDNFGWSDVKCPILPKQFPYGAVYARRQTYSSKAQVICFYGYHIKDVAPYTNIQTLQCQDDGVWSKPLPTCNCKCRRTIMHITDTV